jgi:hypothetical protein
MKYSKKSFALLTLLTSIIGSAAFAQDSFNYTEVLKFSRNWTVRTELEKEVKRERAREVIQDNEYTTTGYEMGTFLSNPLMLDGKPLDFGEFTLSSTGELTVLKGAAATEQGMEVPFYVYLRRNGNKVHIPGKENFDPNQIKIDITEILRHAAHGDQLVIEAVKKEDGSVKRILKLLNDGC